ncbi:DNA mismatch endonuclease Vsr [Alistipes sp. kh20]|uniref:very short patch repair endonuclease n=1 Tax=Alistipes montrealensis TaxID=2834113 RepID=UPI001BCEEED9|nr:very short patch repair endonuclease [Alistipes montrealensis]MBS4766490.1 DNA mismatch endonuclease Vsr [Alistipes montrealensis]
MADVHTPETRSYNMSQVRSRNTKPELIVRKYLFSQGFRYRINVKRLPGTPDVVLTKYKTVIFINGCFWHGHDGCRYFVIPQTRTEWWINKINQNKQRDLKNLNILKQSDWHVITIWECQLKQDAISTTLEEIKKEILSEQ